MLFGILYLGWGFCLDNFVVELIEKTNVIETAGGKVVREVNTQILQAYWQVGRIIVEYEQKSPDRAEYGRQTLKELSKLLTEELGKGFSVSNLQFMRRFYSNYDIQQTVSVKLTWSHYCELLLVGDKDRRGFYEKECVKSNGSVRELKRQIATSLFERLLLSKGEANEEVNERGDNPPIGIILCTDKDALQAEYALGGLKNTIFASKYTYVIPNKDELIAQVEKVLNSH